MSQPRTARRRRPTVAAVLAGAVVAVLAMPATSTSAATTTYAKDGFDHRHSSGWGSAQTGGRWSVAGGSKSSVSGSAAVVKGVKGGRSMRASLSGVSKADVLVSASFVVPKTRNVYLSVEARRQADGSAYRGRARIDAKGELHSEVVRINGAKETILAMNTTGWRPKAGTAVRVDLEVTGSAPTRTRSRAYAEGSKTPAWVVSASDESTSAITRAGKVGVHFYNTARNAKTDVKVTSFRTTRATAASTPPVVQDPVGTGTQPSTGPTPEPGSGTSPEPGSGATTDPSTGAGTGGGNAGDAGASTGPAGRTYGSAPVGSTTYPVPAGAIFVSTTGSDAGDGSQARPLATVTKAIAKARSGSTIVLRGGTYHQYFIVPPGKDVTVQAAPGEAVWFDGASPVEGFTSAGDGWVVDGWTTEFDSSPTYTKGAPDGTAPGWQFVNPANPMAAHPDAVWIDGTEQKQVAGLDQLRAGTFFVDDANDKLYLGSDPTGRLVEASTLAQAVSLRAPGTTLRGLGFKRYADSVWQQGVITAYWPGMTLENLVVADSATAGIGLFKPSSVVRDVTVTGSGQLGMQAGYADGLLVDNVKIVDSNDEHFNPAPSAGGFKVTMTRGFTMKDSEIAGTEGNGFWTDQSTFDIDLVDNYIHDGSRWGVVLEISSTAAVVGNVITRNAYDGLMVADTDHVDIWNNTIVGNGRAAVALTQDTRRIEQLSVSGHDPRRPQPDLTMPWTTTGTTMGDNVLGGGSGTDPILRVQAWDKAFAASDMLVASDGNVFSQTAVGAPRYVTVWGRKASSPVSSTTLDAYVATSGRDGGSMGHLGASPVDGSYRLVPSIAAHADTIARPLPADVAARAGRTAGAKQLGAL